MGGDYRARNKPVNDQVLPGTKWEVFDRGCFSSAEGHHCAGITYSPASFAYLRSPVCHSIVKALFKVLVGGETAEVRAGRWPVVCETAEVGGGHPWIYAAALVGCLGACLWYTWRATFPRSALDKHQS